MVAYAVVGVPRCSSCGRDCGCPVSRARCPVFVPPAFARSPVRAAGVRVGVRVCECPALFVVFEIVCVPRCGCPALRRALRRPALRAALRDFLGKQAERHLAEDQRKSGNTKDTLR